METRTGNPLFPSILTLLSCIFTSLYVVPLPGLLPCQRGGTRVPPPQSPCTPLGRDKFFVADSDTTMRQMRQISALQNPSPATAVPPCAHPFIAIFRRSTDTNLPRVRQRFPSWPRYNYETMRQISATKIHHSYDVCLISYERSPHPPVFAAMKSPGMRQGFRSWLRYNHEINQTATTPNRLQRPAACILDPSHQDLRYLEE